MSDKTFAETCGELREAWLALLTAALFPAMQRTLDRLTRPAIRIGYGAEHADCRDERKP